MISYVSNQEKRWKAKDCADGQKQREYTDRTTTASPTAMTELILTKAANDAKEKQDVTIMDLPGAFLLAWNDKKVIMFMKGKLAELMVHVAPQIYRKYITTMKTGEQILYKSSNGTTWHYGSIKNYEEI